MEKKHELTGKEMFKLLQLDSTSLNSSFLDNVIT